MFKEAKQQYKIFKKYYNLISQCRTPENIKFVDRKMYSKMNIFSYNQYCILLDKLYNKLYDLNIIL